MRKNTNFYTKLHLSKPDITLYNDIITFLLCHII